MANTNGAFGLRPIGVVGQATNTTGMTEYRIASGNSNAIYQGSPVIPLSTGFIDIVGAAAGGSVGLLGVFWGCEYVSSTTGEKIYSNNWPGSGADSNHPVVAFVYDNPMQTFVIASDASLTQTLRRVLLVLRPQVFPRLSWVLAQSPPLRHCNCVLWASKMTLKMQTSRRLVFH
jgi:hypothetical protein